MLVAMNGEGALLGQTGPDPVGAFAIFAPNRSGPQAPTAERLVVRRGAATIDRHPVSVGQQHATADAPDPKKKPIEIGLGGTDQRFNSLTCQIEFSGGQLARQISLGRIKAMEEG